VVAGTLAALIMPPERMLPSASAKGLIVPDGPQANEKWDASLTPYIIEPLDLMAMDSGVNEFDIRKSAQTGFTTLILAAIKHIIDQDPCRVMIVQPTSGALATSTRTSWRRRSRTRRR
jgi:phage terminase large subunit GpA-like protein